MPELPEVETIRRALVPVLVGRTVTRVTVRNPALRTPVDESALRQHTVNRRVQELRRRGKSLLVDFDGNSSVLVHLGMSGRLQLRPREAPLDKHEHVIFDLDNSLQLRYSDPRRFGSILAGLTDWIESHPSLAYLGPEPLSKELTPEALAERLHGKKQPIKNALLDQRLLAGLGNIYVNESLFRAGISPFRPAGALSDSEVAALLQAIRDVLSEALRRGGTTLRDYADPNGNPGLFALDLQVYHRAGQPCPRCGAPVQEARLAGRSTFWCGECQR